MATIIAKANLGRHKFFILSLLQVGNLPFFSIHYLVLCQPSFPGMIHLTGSYTESLAQTDHLQKDSLTSISGLNLLVSIAIPSMGTLLNPQLPAPQGLASNEIIPSTLIKEQGPYGGATDESLDYTYTREGNLGK
ncbi:MAG: hypothetical protein Ct9H300mP29_8580 [Candidatus Neomarinimicrobiota bacterium]|nr:MAG: hypothetical protein Ct9H300mP29_8580 [Candidatus Neomarinimicrobiota bacterium]